jgi:hypothetical protein
MYLATLLRDVGYEAAFDMFERHRSRGRRESSPKDGGTGGTNPSSVRCSKRFES